MRACEDGARADELLLPTVVLGKFESIAVPGSSLLANLTLHVAPVVKDTSFKKLRGPVPEVHCKCPTWRLIC